MKTTMTLTLLLAMALLAGAAVQIEVIPGQLPVFKAKNLIDNKELDLAKLKGQVIIVDFWATWCPPCVKEIPDFIRLYKQYKEKGFTIVGISVDADQKAVKKFIKEHKITYPIIMVSEAIKADFEKVLEKPIRGMPTTIIIDREGKLVSVHEGYTKKEVFLKELKPLLKKELPKEKTETRR
jgi:thiol-disulfide isomerase/thioredoxin